MMTKRFQSFRPLSLLRITYTRATPLTCRIITPLYICGPPRTLEGLDGTHSDDTEAVPMQCHKHDALCHMQKSNIPAQHYMHSFVRP